MNGIAVLGCGAVSPAGWGVDALLSAVGDGAPLAAERVERPGALPPLAVRRVPAPTARPDWAAHPRFRRCSPITRHAMAAAREALAGVPQDGARYGIVSCVTAGCVQYSRRFYAEALADPATASPLVFPETVFNAPASHLAAGLGWTAVNDTLIGDGAHFVAGVELAVQWIEDGQVDRCLVLGAEEVDWVVADAFRRFRRDTVTAEGAGALLVGRPIHPSDVLLEWVSVSDCFNGRAGRSAAARELDASLAGRVGAADLVVDGPGPNWAGAGRRVVPGNCLGEALSAGAAWQAVTAVAAVARGQHARAVSRCLGWQTHAGTMGFARGGSRPSG